ncbi:MAG: hypothetical protein ABL897_05220, partial [Hyphomicrobium sp.]
GTGSGAIAVTLLAELPGATAVASDLSAAALAVPSLAAARQQDLLRLDADLAAEANRRAEFDVAREASKARSSEAENARQALAAARARAERLAALEQQHAAAVALESTISILSQDLNADGTTPARVNQLSALAHARDLANAELRGEAARVDIAIEPGGEGRVRLEGAVVAGSLRHDVPESAAIDIDGIAKIRVTSAGAERAAAARVNRDGAERQIAAVLAAIGVASIEDARAQADVRARKVEDLERARAKLSGVAPHGAAAIANEQARLTSADASTGSIAALEDDVAKREAAAHVMRQRVETLKSTVLSDDAFRALSAEREAVRTAEVTATRDIARLTSRIDNLKSEQAGADEDGRAGQVAALSGAFERHTAEVKRLEAEGQALLLLARTLDGIEAKARDAYFAPVTRRVQPYLNEVFGSADLGFKDAFAIDSLTRGGERQTFSVLSDGTREQLSVLVRLGFAELLAARGVAVPLVLDDPLVYSDDERLTKVCRVLETASRALQIIVLTCRATAFQTLSGRRVSVTAWQPDT